MPYRATEAFNDLKANFADHILDQMRQFGAQQSLGLPDTGALEALRDKATDLATDALIWVFDQWPECARTEAAVRVVSETLFPMTSSIRPSPPLQVISAAA